MKPPLEPKKLSQAKARNAALMNQLATPGLGSLLAGRWLAGSGQLLLAIAGFTLVLVWFIQMMRQYYGEMFGNETTHSPIVFTALLLGAVLFVISWFWSLATSISLVREASRADVDSLKLFAAGQVKLDDGKINSALSTLPNWERTGETISRTFEFQDFPAAMKFVNAVAQIAEQAQHHPDIDVRWNKVRLALTTHDAGGLTEKDFAIARKCDALSLR